MNFRINFLYKRIKDLFSPCVASFFVFLLASSNQAAAKTAKLTILPTQTISQTGNLAGIEQISLKPENQFGAIPSSLRDTIIDKVEQMPTFRGGEKGLQKHVKNNVNKSAKKPKITASGLVVVQFVVDEQGKVGDIQVVKSLSPEADVEAVRIVEMMPDFTPALRNGEPVAFRYTLPVRFSPGNK